MGGWVGVRVGEGVGGSGGGGVLWVGGWVVGVGGGAALDSAAERWVAGAGPVGVMTDEAAGWFCSWPAGCAACAPAHLHNRTSVPPPALPCPLRQAPTAARRRCLCSSLRASTPATLLWRQPCPRCSSRRRSRRHAHARHALCWQHAAGPHNLSLARLRARVSRCLLPPSSAFAFTELRSQTSSTPGDAPRARCPYDCTTAKALCCCPATPRSLRWRRPPPAPSL